MRAWWNSFLIAFSMYSKIPMPQSDWSKENMRCVMCFFPLVGAAIGALMCLWAYLADFLGLTQGETRLFYGAVLMLIPVAVSGGIHLDGFLDTSDALSSWQPVERRLEILKDSRCGAFAVIAGCSYFALSLGVYTALELRPVFLITCLNFVLSRTLSALAIVRFPMAKNTGLAASFSDAAQKRTVAVWMVCFFLATAAAMLALQPVYGAAALLTALLVFCFYHRMACRNFGGITGDLAGWFVEVCELAVPLVLVILEKIYVI